MSCLFADVIPHSHQVFAAASQEFAYPVDNILVYSEDDDNKKTVVPYDAMLKHGGVYWIYLLTPCTPELPKGRGYFTAVFVHDVKCVSLVESASVMETEGVDALDVRHNNTHASVEAHTAPAARACK
jgi:hypothetical protein